MTCEFHALFGKARPFVLTLFAAVCFTDACFAGTERILYDVDFDGSPHTVGAEPEYGFGAFPRKTPTKGGQISQPFGSAEVVHAFGPLTNRPVELTALDGTPNDPGFLGGANMEFDLDELLNPELTSIDRYHASVDVVPNQLRTSSGLGIFFDASSIHSVQFSPDGNIRVIDATGLNQVVGPYFPEDFYHVQMTFDRAAVEWSASINGVPIYHGPAHGNDMDRFRIATTTGDTISPAVAFVDNIRVSGEVPEPGTICLTCMSVFGVGVVATRRRRHG